MTHSEGRRVSCCRRADTVLGYLSEGRGKRTHNHAITGSFARSHAHNSPSRLRRGAARIRLSIASGTATGIVCSTTTVRRVSNNKQTPFRVVKRPLVTSGFCATRAPCFCASLNSDFLERSRDANGKFTRFPSVTRRESNEALCRLWHFG